MPTLKVPVSADDHIQGVLTAPIQLVEYGDYECGFCGHAYPIVKRVQKHYKELLCFVFRNFPLSEIHPHAQMAAETAEFAAAHKRFWEMHDLLYENQQRLDLPLLVELTELLNLSTDELVESLEKQVYLPKVRSDFLGGVKSGVNGTPTFFINGLRHNGPFEYENLVYAIDQVLQKTV